MATPEVKCFKCGSVNPPNSAYCSSCGSSLSVVPGAQPVMANSSSAFQPSQPPIQTKPPYPSPAPSYPQQPTSNRATIALVCGIAGFFCGPIAAIPGIILGKMEMNAIERGQSAASGMGMAKAAFYLSIVALVVSIGACMIMGMLGVFGQMVQRGGY